MEAGLQRGAGPEADLGQLEGEITAEPSGDAGSLPSAGNSRELVSRARADPPGRDAPAGYVSNDPQQYPQQYGRETTRPGATRRGEGAGAMLRPDARKALACAEKDDDARPGAASCPKATRRTRTDDLSFTKAPLYLLS